MTQKLAALAIAIALPALASASDINPGALQLSGKTAFDYSSTTHDDGTIEVDTTRLGGGLSAMYYVSRFLAFGLSTDYEKVENTSGGVTETEGTFLFGPKAGIDWELLKHFSVFADLTIGMAQRTVLEQTGSGIGWEVGAGFKLFLNQNVSLDLMGNFKRVDVDHPVLGKVTDMGFGAGVGISVYLTNNPANSREQEYRPETRPAYPPEYR